MLHVFSTNRVKLVARTPKATNNKGQREYIFALFMVLLIWVNITWLVLTADGMIGMAIITGAFGLVGLVAGGIIAAASSSSSSRKK